MSKQLGENEMAKVTKRMLLEKLHADYQKAMWAAQAWQDKIKAGGAGATFAADGLAKAESIMAYVNALIVDIGLRAEPFEMKIDIDPDTLKLDIFEKGPWQKVQTAGASVADGDDE